MICFSPFIGTFDAVFMVCKSNAKLKICERYIHNTLNPFVDKYLSVFISAYRKAYSANDVLIRFIEKWKQSLVNHKYVGIVKPIVCTTLNERDFSFNKCCATINVRNFFPTESRNLQHDLRNFFSARHFQRFIYLFIYLFTFFKVD